MTLKYPKDLTDSQISDRLQKATYEIDRLGKLISLERQVWYDLRQEQIERQKYSFNPPTSVDG